MRLQQLFELLVQLVELGRNHVLAVRLVWIVRVIFLVVAFSWVEFGERLQRCHDGILKRLRLVQFFHERRGFGFLNFIGVENRRAVLGAGVVALAIQRRRVVGGEKHRH